MINAFNIRHRASLVYKQMNTRCVTTYLLLRLFRRKPEKLQAHPLPKAASRFVLFVVVGSYLLLTGCASFFVGFVSNPGGATSISGTITVVNLAVLNGPSGATTFTAVTFINVGNAVTTNFCGDQRNLFRINDNVRADFNTGFNCSVLVQVVIITGNG